MINIKVLLLLTELEGFHLTQSDITGNGEFKCPSAMWGNHYSLKLPPAFTLLAVQMKTPAASKASRGQHHLGPKLHLLLWPVVELSHHTSKTFLHRTSVHSLSTIWDTGGNITFLGFSFHHGEFVASAILCLHSSTKSCWCLPLWFFSTLLILLCHTGFLTGWLIPSFSLPVVLPDHFLTSKASPSFSPCS